MNDNGHRTLPPDIATAETRPANVMAQLTVTMFTDKPPILECTGDLVTALRLLSLGVGLVSQLVEQQGRTADRVPVEDKKREYLGSRK